MFQPGDRVRWETIGDDGLPLVRYGFVGAFHINGSHVTVMLDGDLTGNTLVESGQLAPVSITTVELRLQGSDLLDDPSLRQGLVNLWSAEAEEAGLEIRVLSSYAADGTRADDTGSYELAELWAGSEQYVLRAAPDVMSGTVNIRADLPRYA
jgi:hypothetical protein